MLKDWTFLIIGIFYEANNCLIYNEGELNMCDYISLARCISLCVVFEFAGSWVLNLTFAVILSLFDFFFWGTYCTYRGWSFEGAKLWHWLIVCVFTDSSVSAGTVEQQLMFMYEPESINNLTRELILKLGRSPAYVMALNEKVIFCLFYVLDCLNIATS